MILEIHVCRVRVCPARVCRARVCRVRVVCLCMCVRVLSVYTGHKLRQLEVKIVDIFPSY